MSSFQYYIRLATDKNTLRRALRVALIVGIILNIVNHPEVISAFSIESLNPGQLILTFFVPYCVSTYSSVLSNSKIKPGRVSHLNATLRCINCKHEITRISIGETINICPLCKERTHWKLSEIHSIVPSKENLLKQLAETKTWNSFPVITLNSGLHLPLEKFREMDYYAVESYGLPIELMMENAGLQLARLLAALKPEKGKILFGIGTGNNGGGGLVAARRMQAWGYEVYIHLPVKKLNPLAEKQHKRSIDFGVKEEYPDNPDLFVDAYLGFSQRLPLSETYQKAMEKSNSLQCKKISLDLPTGFDSYAGTSLFRPDIILTLAAMKSELLKYESGIEFYLADLGIPSDIYAKFGITQPKEFKKSGLLYLNIDG